MTDDGEYLWTTPYASGLVVVRGGEIVETAPIYYKLRGQSVRVLDTLLQSTRKGFRLEKLEGIK